MIQGQLLALLLPVVLSLWFFSSSHAHNFLILGGDGSGSHYYVATAIGKELAYRGNNVTVLVSDMYADDASKLQDANLFNFVIYKSLVTAEQFQSVLAKVVQVSLSGDLSSIPEVNERVYAMLKDQCESILMDSPVLNRLRQEKFDLIIGDLWYICVGIVAQFLEVPFATLLPGSVSMSIMTQINACPTNPAYIPDMITGLDTKMNFMDRVKNTVTVSINTVLNRRMLFRYDELKIKYNIKPEIATFNALGEAELCYINTDFALEFPRPLLPHVVPVGGLTTKPAKLLPQVKKYNRYGCLSINLYLSHQAREQYLLIWKQMNSAV